MIILQVEDSPSDVQVTVQALKDASHTVYVVTDGAAALCFLRGGEGSLPAPRPDLILLDGSLPKVSGHDVLKEIKGDPQLKAIPVVMMSSASDAESKRRAYEFHANAYLVKPLDYWGYISAIRCTVSYWDQILHFVP